MAGIRFKKPLYPINQRLRNYLKETHRETDVPISYLDLTHASSTLTFFDKSGEDTLWETMIYAESDRQFIHDALRKVYAQLKVGGDTRSIDHLFIDRVDYCLYANTHPFRVRIVNGLNDLFDYFYIKRVDASRVYGMELEHLLSPNKINYLIKGDTFIEEHIPGMPGDHFKRHFLRENTQYNPLRIAKEFVKFNERCLVQLLGDMRGDNFVAEVIPDFDELHFRLRAIDFDQQSHEGNSRIYMPQYLRENNPIINLGFKSMSPVLALQYQREERMRLLSRVAASSVQLSGLLDIMAADVLAKPENVFQLRNELSSWYQDDAFFTCGSMGEIVRVSLQMLEKYPVRHRSTQKPLAA